LTFPPFLFPVTVSSFSMIAAPYHGDTDKKKVSREDRGSIARNPLFANAAVFSEQVNSIHTKAC